MARMNFMKFIIFTTIGASAWNMFLAYVGYILKSNWKEIMKYSKVFDLIVILAIFLLSVYFLYKQLKKSKQKGKVML
jgi:membrane protein DedA with SNARE-associated domain